jgi:hypothetical protein
VVLCLKRFKPVKTDIGVRMIGSRRDVMGADRIELLDLNLVGVNSRNVTEGQM